MSDFSEEGRGGLRGGKSQGGHSAAERDNAEKGGRFFVVGQLPVASLSGVK